MFEEIISTLRSQAAPELISKLGLDAKQADGSINAAADSVKEVIGGGDGFGLDDVLNLFSDQQNSSAANGILSNIGGLLQNKLTGDVGLSSAKAGGVSDMLLPMLTQMLSKYVGGDSNNLQNLIGNLGGEGGLAGIAKGLLGNLFK